MNSWIGGRLNVRVSKVIALNGSLKIWFDLYWTFDYLFKALCKTCCIVGSPTDWAPVPASTQYIVVPPPRLDVIVSRRSIVRNVLDTSVPYTVRKLLVRKKLKLLVRKKLTPPLPSNRHRRSNGDCLEGKRGKLSGLIYAILCATIVHSAMSTHMNRPNSSLDWVLSHWTHFTVLRFIFVYVCIFCMTVHCMHVQYCNMMRWTWWDGSLSLGLLLPSVLWHCWLGHLIRKMPSLIWPIMCLVGR